MRSRRPQRRRAPCSELNACGQFTTIHLRCRGGQERNADCKNVRFCPVKITQCRNVNSRKHWRSMRYDDRLSVAHCLPKPRRMAVIDRTNSLSSLEINGRFFVAHPKLPGYYVFLGSRKTAVPPIATFAKSGNSKTSSHHSESLCAVSDPSFLGIPLTKICSAMRKGGSCAQAA